MTNSRTYRRAATANEKAERRVSQRIAKTLARSRARAGASLVSTGTTAASKRAGAFVDLVPRDAPVVVRYGATRVGIEADAEGAGASKSRDV